MPNNKHIYRTARQYIHVRVTSALYASKNIGGRVFAFFTGAGLTAAAVFDVRTDDFMAMKLLQIQATTDAFIIIIIIVDTAISRSVCTSVQRTCVIR